jgi:ABC-type multidrug transport system ATPase subunit
MFRARDIQKRFGRRRILDGASLDLAPGEIVHLSGANGSGKTTFAQILATILRADHGALTLDGESIERRIRVARRALGFASHRPLLYLGLTPLENLAFFGRLSGVADAGARAGRMLERFGLGAFARTPIERFSRGMLQRVALTRALLPEPRVLLLDEPYAGLDDEGASTLNEMLSEARARGAATLIISHERARAGALVSRGCALRAGRIEASA